MHESYPPKLYEQIVNIVTRQRSSLGTVFPGILKKVLKDKRLKLKCCIINYNIKYF